MDEPGRKSFFDVLKRNLSLADRYGFTTRLVYIGEYNGSHEQVIKQMTNIVDFINEEHGEVILTGLLLVYPKYFIHLVEASEETIYRHYQFLLSSKGSDGDEFFGRIILLPALYNVFRIYFSEWYFELIQDPPDLTEKIEVAAEEENEKELNEIKNQVKACLYKMYKLCEYLHVKGRYSPEKIFSTLNDLATEMPHLLIEYSRIEYLLTVESPAIQDLRDYVKEFEEIPLFNFYSDRIWPPVKPLLPQINRKADTENGD